LNYWEVHLKGICGALQTLRLSEQVCVNLHVKEKPETICKKKKLCSWQWYRKQHKKFIPR